jgi:hypothetical protein
MVMVVPVGADDREAEYVHEQAGITAWWSVPPCDVIDAFDPSQNRVKLRYHGDNRLPDLT